MNLFVIGTGFDKAHDIPSMYADFRKHVAGLEAPSHYLERQCQTVLDGFQTYEPENAFDALTYIISETGEDDEWNEFEKTLGELDFTSYLICQSSSESEQYIREHNHDTLEKFINVAEDLKQCFKEWAQQITVQAEKKPSFEKLISHEDVFLTFNYTDTLEKIYGITQNVFHIHGTKEGEIVFGHGDSEINFELFEQDYPGCESGLSEIKARLRKPTKKVLEGNVMKSFLECISSHEIDRVYSYGFSYSNVDLVYMKEICKRLKPTTEWLFNDFDDVDKRKTFENKLRQCGFAGTVSSFHID